MPLGKPTSDGEILTGSRHYSGKPNPLGEVRVWNCPSCGKRNETQLPEHGCAHCGAGDQRLGKAGNPARTEAAGTGQPARGPLLQVAASTAYADVPTDTRIARPLRDVPAASVRILRLIEYLVVPGKDVTWTLRNSLVGTLHFDWGQLTGTIVDSCDANQEDRLRLAKMQPGVWLGNEMTMRGREVKGIGSQPPLGANALDARVVAYNDQRSSLESEYHLIRERLKEPLMSPTPPDTGPAFTRDQEVMAQQIRATGEYFGAGYKLCYTLALALQSIAEELAANIEPEKFLTREEALSLANALMAQIPAEWNPEPPDTDAEEIPPQTIGDM